MELQIMVKKSDWNGPQGSEDMGKDPLRRENKNSWATKDISRIADKAADVDDGFSGKLPKGE
jgi:hypothetical protein